MKKVLGKAALRLKIALRGLDQHLLSTSITVLSAAMGCGLVMAVFALSQQSRAAFGGGPVGFDAVVGARGSELQLVLNTVFHLETSPGNIPYSLYEELRETPGVELAVPYALGDNYRGFRIVGTTPELFDALRNRAGGPLRVRPPGRLFDPRYAQAVIGATVATAAQLELGASFHPHHGEVHDPSAEHIDEYEVVGVLEPTRTPVDRVIWIPLEGIYHMDGHVLVGPDGEHHHEPGEEIPDAVKELSAVMLQLKSPAVGYRLEQQIDRRGQSATLAWPIGAVMAEFFQKVGWIARVLELVAALVLIVAAASILAILYNSMSERRRDLAILRALGASRRTVFGVIVLEASAIALLGALLGYGVHFLILLGAAALIHEQTGVVLDAFAWTPAMAWTPLGMLALGALAGVLPALKAYRTDVASNLVPRS